MKIQEYIRSLGFEPSEYDENLYYRKAEDAGHDVIRYFPYEELYNISTFNYYYDFIDEKQLIKILAK